MKPIYLKLSTPSDKLATGASRFWGNPDLPKDFNFPTYIDKSGEKYHYFFICQINLEELAKLDVLSKLPKNGLLSFFAKIDYYMGYYNAPMEICGSVSDKEAVKVLYFPSCEDLAKKILMNDDNELAAPDELQIEFRRHIAPLSEEHSLFTHLTHRPWETWDTPFEDWEILLQVDSFERRGFRIEFHGFWCVGFPDFSIRLKTPML